jgi:3-keto-L-gulonate-6-phosphate decarboxylase
MLDNNLRYVQLAFNYDTALVARLLPRLRLTERLLIEAGTPFLKREGMKGIRTMRTLWQGHIVADLKIADGAVGEVEMARAAGATAVTALGSSPTETLDLFIAQCTTLGMISMVDMIGVQDPLKVVRPLKHPPDVVVLHRGRDEESTRGKMIQYRHINRLRSKYDIFIAAAGGIDLREARSAVFNGAALVVVNLVHPNDEWAGIPTTGNVPQIVEQYLAELA